MKKYRNDEQGYGGHAADFCHQFDCHSVRSIDDKGFEAAIAEHL